VLAVALSHNGWQGVAAAAAILQATPNPVVIPAGQSQGTTSLTWNTGDGTFGYLYVRHGNAPAVAVDGGSGPSGVVSAPVLLGDNLFQLLGADLASVLAEVDVKGQPPPLTHVPQPSTPAGGIGGAGSGPQGAPNVGSNQPTICPHGCNGAGSASSTPPTLTLQASQIVHSYTFKIDGPGWEPYPCPFLPGEPSFASPGGFGLDQDGSPVAWGFWHNFDPGTQPFPCWEANNWSVQTAVAFDWDAMTRFTAEHGLRSAVLRWSGEIQGDLDTCTLRVWGSSWPLTGLHSGLNLDLQGAGRWLGVVLNNQNDWSTDISDIFFSPVSVLHFDFIGPDDPLTAHENARNYCEMSGLSLVITGDH
jgi:hypothetical protein